MFQGEWHKSSQIQTFNLHFLKKTNMLVQVNLSYHACPSVLKSCLGEFVLCDYSWSHELSLENIATTKLLYAHCMWLAL